MTTFIAGPVSGLHEEIEWFLGILLLGVGLIPYLKLKGELRHQKQTDSQIEVAAAREVVSLLRDGLAELKAENAELKAIIKDLKTKIVALGTRVKELEGYITYAQKKAIRSPRSPKRTHR